MHHRMLKKLIPKSLQSQLVLMVLGVVLLVQAATFISVTWSWRQFTQSVAIDLTLTTLRTLRGSLEVIPDSQKNDFVKKVSGGQWRLWSRTLPSHTRLDKHKRDKNKALARQNQVPTNIRRVLQPFIDKLNMELGDETRVALSHGSNPQIYVSMPGNSSQREWLVIPIDRIAPSIRTSVVLMWLAGMTTLLLLAAAFSWHITRPLTKLAKAADKLAAGTPERVKPSGPKETVLLGQRFNAMLDALSESAEVQRTLLAGLPHDLKGPLSRMWLRIEMIDNTTFQEGMRNDLKDMQKMVDQFISFVRGNDPASYQFKQIKFIELLTQKVEAWREINCQITLYKQTSLESFVMADELAINRLLDNLISNSLQHGQEPIEIIYNRTEKHVVITVKDHGQGIKPEEVDQALRPFSKLDEARTMTGSVGLGLALSEIIVKSHKGSLKLITNKGQGLAVQIEIPLSKQSIQAT